MHSKGRKLAAAWLLIILFCLIINIAACSITKRVISTVSQAYSAAVVESYQQKLGEK